MNGGAEIAQGVLAFPQRVAFIPRSRTLVLADLHLAFSAVERRRGTSVPPVDEVTAKSLETVVTQLAPKRVVLLGDIAHAIPRTEEESRHVIDPLRALASRAELHLVLGNHDRRLADVLPEELRVRCCTRLELDGYEFTHGDDLSGLTGRSMLGHFHPAVTVPGPSGAQQKFPVFLANARRIVLPAFSPWAGGLNVLGQRGAEVITRAELHDSTVFACGSSRVMNLGPIERLAALVRGTSN